MDSVAEEALTAAAAAVRALLPAADGALLAPQLALHPTRIRATGIGGVVAASRDPAGLIVGRTVHAAGTVTARTTDLSRLDEAVARVMAALVAADRAAMRASGIQDLELGAVGAPASIRQPGPGGDVVTRDVALRLVFEHLHHPAAGEGVIEEIPIAVDVGTGD